MSTGPIALPDRIKRNSAVDGNGCWIWQGSLDWSGYGQIGVRPGGHGRCSSRGAHRVSYETFVGPIPDGLVIDHLCRVRSCVNPDHLEPVTNRENVVARAPKSIVRINADKTHCPQGHPYSPENTYVAPRSGKRHCRACQRERERTRQRVWS